MSSRRTHSSRRTQQRRTTHTHMGSSRINVVTFEEDEEEYIDSPMHDFDDEDTFSGPNGAGRTGKPMSRRDYEAQAAAFDFHSRSSANPAVQHSGAQRFAQGSSYGAAVDGDFWKCFPCNDNGTVDAYFVKNCPRPYCNRPRGIRGTFETAWRCAICNDPIDARLGTCYRGCR